MQLLCVVPPLVVWRAAPSSVQVRTYGMNSARWPRCSPRWKYYGKQDNWYVWYSWPKRFSRGLMPIRYYLSRYVLFVEIVTQYVCEQVNTCSCLSFSSFLPLLFAYVKKRSTLPLNSDFHYGKILEILLLQWAP